jgi:hypothetical protein
MTIACLFDATSLSCLGSEADWTQTVSASVSLATTDGGCSRFLLALRRSILGGVKNRDDTQLVRRFMDCVNYDVGQTRDDQL